jgi:hypothetical protein
MGGGGGEYIIKRRRDERGRINVHYVNVCQCMLLIYSLVCEITVGIELRLVIRFFYTGKLHALWKEIREM